MPRNPLDPFNKDQKHSILQQAIHFWDTSTDMMEEFFQMVNDAENMYRCQLPEDLAAEFDKHPDRAALAPPDFYINIKRLRAGLRRLIFSRRPYATLSAHGRPEVRADSIRKAEWKLQAMCDEQNDGRGFESEADLVFMQALYGGVSCAFTNWVTKRIEQPLRGPNGRPVFDDLGRPVMEKIDVGSYAETKSVDIRRVRIDPSAELIEDARLLGYHGLVGLTELLDLGDDPNTDYIFDRKDVEKTSFQRDKYFEWAKGDSDKYQDKAVDHHNFSDKIAERWEIRGLFRLPEKNGGYKTEDLIVRVINRSTLVTARYNNLPIKGWDLFDFATMDKEIGRLFTMGLVEPAMDAWMERFIKKNQSLDEASRRTYDRYIGDTAACEDLPDFLEDAPGVIYKVDTAAAGLSRVTDALAPMARPSMGQDTFNQSLILKDDIQQMNALNDFTGGLDPSRKETATAVNALTSGGQNMLVEMAIQLKDSFLGPAWRKSLILYNFFEGHKEGQITTPEGDQFTISPNELNLYYKIDMDLATQADQPTIVRRLVESFPQLRVSPEIDQDSLMRAMVELLQLPNPEKLLPPSQYKALLVERENMALMYGIEIPVDPQDNDTLHIKLHTEAITAVQQIPPEVAAAQGVTVQALIEHTRFHEQQLAEKNNQGNANSKDLGGGAQLTNPENGAIRQGAGLPSEARA